MLDPDTLRLTLAGVSVTVLLLFYVGVYRPTRSSFSGWWSLALLSAGAASTVVLIGGPIALYLFNALSVIGSVGTWFAMRSLRHRRLPRWIIVVGPALVVFPTWLQDAETNIWAGAGQVSALMGALFSVGAVEMWLAWRDRRAVAGRTYDAQAANAYFVCALAASFIGTFYVLRSIMYYLVGPYSEVFELTVGTSSATLVLLICLVAVTFSVSAVGWDQETNELRRRAMEDDLTGLLSRGEFRTQAQRMLTAAHAGGHDIMLVIADLDYFKSVNDKHGHDAGDRALREFGTTLTQWLRPGEVAGRIGGEEFGLILFAETPDSMIARLKTLSESYADQRSRYAFDLPTASYGITLREPDDTVAGMFVRADVALHVAKVGGRNQAVVYDAEQGHEQILSERRHLRDSRPKD